MASKLPLLFDAFMDGFTGAGLFGRLRRPGAPTEFVDSRSLEEFIGCDEYVSSLGMASQRNYARGTAEALLAEADDLGPGVVRGELEVSRTLAAPQHDAQPDHASAIAKRLFDLVVSTCALLLLIPVMVVIALAIKLTSPGPALFWQERLGRGMRRFYICKFRTMVFDAEAREAEMKHPQLMTAAAFTLKRDPRITSIGVFLRRTSLDELPQLFNVWRGDMSLVGPRPWPLTEYRQLSEAYQRRRFNVKPGMTGLWQVSGQNLLSSEKSMDFDMEYVDRRSFWLDLKILVQAIPALVRGSGG
jgi:lipopolysaccharide/colanic/teichoic acid biosynthesis glycosyltransferase